VDVHVLIGSKKSAFTPVDQDFKMSEATNFFIPFPMNIQYDELEQEKMECEDKKSFGCE
jgi:hypothetical protein